MSQWPKVQKFTVTKFEKVTKRFHSLTHGDQIWKSYKTFSVSAGIVHTHDMAKSSHKLVAVGTNINHVYLVDIKSGSQIQELRGHADEVLCLAWSPRWETNTEGQLFTQGIKFLAKMNLHKGKNMNNERNFLTKKYLFTADKISTGNKNPLTKMYFLLFRDQYCLATGGSEGKAGWPDFVQIVPDQKLNLVEFVHKLVTLR